MTKTFRILLCLQITSGLLAVILGVLSLADVIKTPYITVACLGVCVILSVINTAMLYRRIRGKKQ